MNPIIISTIQSALSFVLSLEGSTQEMKMRQTPEYQACFTHRIEAQMRGEVSTGKEITEEAVKVQDRICLLNPKMWSGGALNTTPQKQRDETMKK